MPVYLTANLSKRREKSVHPRKPLPKGKWRNWRRETAQPVWVILLSQIHQPIATHPLLNANFPARMGFPGYRKFPVDERAAIDMLLRSSAAGN
jgi:hypothetical protein